MRQHVKNMSDAHVCVLCDNVNVRPTNLSRKKERERTHSTRYFVHYASVYVIQMNTPEQRLLQQQQQQS